MDFLSISIFISISIANSKSLFVVVVERTICSISNLSGFYADGNLYYYDDFDPDPYLYHDFAIIFPWISNTYDDDDDCFDL